MKLIRQVISDLLKEIGWVVFYGFLTAMVIMAFILISLSYQHVAEKNNAIGSYVNNDITLTYIKQAKFNVPPEEAAAEAEPEETLDHYFADVFSASGKAGTYTIMYECLGYRQIILLLGVYGDMVPYAPPTDASVGFAVSHDLKERKNQTISFNGTDYPLYVAPPDMDLYHPLYYISAGSEELKDTLFVFSKDYGAINEIFPQSESWVFRKRQLMERFILKSPTTQDLVRMRKAVAGNLGAYVSTNTMQEFLKRTEDSGVRTYLTFMLFYITASVVLFFAMLMNVYRVLKRKVPDYATHHLFGASRLLIFARMFLFALLYHAVPLGGTVYILSLSHMATPITITAVTAALLTAVLFITGIVYKRFLVRFSQGLRRE